MRKQQDNNFKIKLFTDTKYRAMNFFKFRTDTKYRFDAPYFLDIFQGEELFQRKFKMSRKAL